MPLGPHAMVPSQPERQTKPTGRMPRPGTGGAQAVRPSRSHATKGKAALILSTLSPTLQTADGTACAAGRGKQHGAMPRTQQPASKDVQVIRLSLAEWAGLLRRTPCAPACVPVARAPSVARAQPQIKRAARNNSPGVRRRLKQAYVAALATTRIQLHSFAGGARWQRWRGLGLCMMMMMQAMRTPAPHSDKAGRECWPGGVWSGMPQHPRRSDQTRRGGRPDTRSSKAQREPLQRRHSHPPHTQGDTPGAAAASGAKPTDGQQRDALSSSPWQGPSSTQPCGQRRRQWLTP